MNKNEECARATFAGRGRQRRILPTLTGIFGLIIANEVILRISGRQRSS